MWSHICFVCEGERERIYVNFIEGKPRWFYYG